MTLEDTTFQPHATVEEPLFNSLSLVLFSWPAHLPRMRTPFLIFLVTLLCAPGWAEDVVGTWKMNPTRSHFGESDAGLITVRIEPHAKGEVFTYKRIRQDGRTETFSVILYLDGKERDSQYDGLPATQLSRRVDTRTVEIVWTCSNGRRVHVVRRMPPNTHDLLLDWNENQPNAKGVDRHLVLERQGLRETIRGRP
jgi:hypothetical protein